MEWKIRTTILRRTSLVFCSDLSRIRSLSTWSYLRKSLKTKMKKSGITSLTWTAWKSLISFFYLRMSWMSRMWRNLPLPSFSRTYRISRARWWLWSIKRGSKIKLFWNWKLTFVMINMSIWTALNLTTMRCMFTISIACRPELGSLGPLKVPSFTQRHSLFSTLSWYPQERCSRSRVVVCLQMPWGHPQIGCHRSWNSL